jgi:WD40 repeat protein
MDTPVIVNVTRLTPRWSTPVDDYVAAMALSEDYNTLALGTAEGQLHRLDANTGQPLTNPLSLMVMSLTQLYWANHKPNCLAAAGQDATVTVFDGDNTLKRSFGKSWVEQLAWHPTEPWLLVGSGRQVCVWDVNTDTLTYQTAPLHKNVMGVAWHPILADQFAVIAGEQLLRFDLKKASPKRQFTWGALLFDLHWSPDGKVLATATHDNGLHVWYAKSGEDLHMSGYPGRIKTMAWQPNSRFIATAGDADVTIWDFAGKGPAGSMPVVLAAHEAKVTQLAYCGTQLASADAQGQVFVWLPPEVATDNDDLEAPLWAYPTGHAVTQLLYPLADVLYVATAEGQCMKLTTSGSDH